MVAAAVGKASLSVRKNPRTIIISTGDELADIADVPATFQVRRSNNYAVRAGLKLYGVSADMLHLPDDAAIIGARLADCVRAYDVILFSSRVEGLPLGLLQGMAAGCLPIVTRISGMPEAVHSPEVGWVVPPESPDALAGAMSAALTLDPHTFAGMRQRVLRRIQEHFDVDRAYARLIEICES